MLACKKRINNENGRCIHLLFGDSATPGFCTLQSEFQCTDNLAAKCPTLSHSAVQDWLKCRRLFYLKNIRGILRLNHTMSNPIKMGALWDACQGKLYGVCDDGDIYKTIDLYEIEEQERTIVRMVNKAFRDLEIKKDMENLEIQKRFTFRSQFHAIYPWVRNDDFEFLITGVYDRSYPTYFVENKFTTVPDYYQDVFFLTSQVGTYFISNPEFKFCMMELVRTPALKRGEDEDIEKYGNRIYEDIMKRPGWYFIGYSSKTKTYGRKFFRDEFKLDNLTRRYQNIAFEIMDANERDAFYMNETMCRRPFECDMLELCRTGNMSQALYGFKNKPAMELAEELKEEEVVE